MFSVQQEITDSPKKHSQLNTCNLNGNWRLAVKIVVVQTKIEMRKREHLKCLLKTQVELVHVSFS